jgi:hypothetical protein
MIYVVWAEETPYIKVGFTSRDGADSRISSLQVGSPYKLRLAAWMEGSEGTEAYLHRLLSKCSRRGEWFDMQKWTDIEEKDRHKLVALLAPAIEHDVVYEALIRGLGALCVEHARRNDLTSLVRCLGFFSSWIYAVGCGKGCRQGIKAVTHSNERWKELFDYTVREYSKQFDDLASVTDSVLSDANAFIESLLAAHAEV